ncbi:hypothetical protein AB4383_12290 [Vibrio breoganii]|uniref:hypothetical protein n=1 Tax=Vibrio breoganii TaxID=553239 RepID=UPI000C817935|nr:hypothetical protein [Vibrio breoganii]PMK26307.1 hypothetical protein BCU03_19150 [Vibrio breoganii]
MSQTQITWQDLIEGNFKSQQPTAENGKDNLVQECFLFSQMMKEQGITNISHMNNLITRANSWDKFPSIRRRNSFEESGRNVPGISPEAFKLVQQHLGNSKYRGKDYLVGSSEY